MLDFSFLHDEDIITVDNISELDSLLLVLESSGICWAYGDDVTKGLDNSLKEKIEYVRFHEPNTITYGMINPIIANSINHSSGKATYRASELLQLICPDSADSDFEPLSESDLREFLSV